MIPPRSPNELDMLWWLLDHPSTARELRQHFDCSMGTIHNRLIDLRFKTPAQIEGERTGKSYLWSITPAGAKRLEAAR